jgi:hypothetical protein
MAPNLAARATIDGAALVGEVAGLDADGALLLRDAEGCLHRVRSGDRHTHAREIAATPC